MFSYHISISRFIRLFFVVSFSLLFTKGFAQNQDTLSVSPISTNRPNLSQGADVLPKGFVQAEIGFSITKDTPGNSKVKSHTYPDILLRFGLLNRLELQLFGSLQDSVVKEFQDKRTVRGLGPLDIRLVAHLVDEQEFMPEVAIKGSLNLPVGDRKLRPTHAEPAILVAASKSISQQAGVLANAGYSWSEGKPTQHLVLNLYAGLNETISIYIEAASDKPKGQKAAYIADTGILWLLLPNLQLDIAAGKQLNTLATDYFITTGVSFRLPR